MRYVWTILLLMVATCSVQSQEVDYEDDYYEKKRYVGFNMTELVSTFIPFKGRATASGPFGVTWRAGRYKRFFNFQMGARVTDVFDDDINFLNIQLGFGKRKPINDKFDYTVTYNVILSGGGFNVPGEELRDDGATFGLSFGGGIEYKLYKNIGLSVESYFIVGSGDGGPEIRIIPPIGLNLLAKF